MQKPILTLLFCGLFATYAIAQNNSTTPKIVKTTPEFADCNVDPALTEIIVEFNQDMGESYSVPDRLNMPLITGQPKWINKRVISIPVRLYPGKTYSLLFNSQKFQNFRNTQGIPLNPTELHFQTRSISFTTLNQKAYDDFIKIFPLKYSYSSLKGINWNDLLKLNRSELINSESRAEFGLKLLNLLKNAEDPHLWVEFEDQKYFTFLPEIIDQYSNFNKLFERLHNMYYTKTWNCVAGSIDSIGYITFRSWDADLKTLSFYTWPNSAIPMISLSEVLGKVLKYPNLIIDVRENNGGNEEFARQFAGLFIKDSVAYEKVRIFNENSKKFDDDFVKWLVPGMNKLNYNGKIILLTGPGVMSSCESFLLMMKQVPDVKIMGTTSYGSSGNPVPYTLSNGVVVYIPSWQVYTMEGQLIEGKGIRPDIEVLIPKENFQAKDALFEKVVWGIKNGI
ncbi:MAG TPA: S41 family peptidase [Bacteroidales bacterium]|nr:S41 family peptidase [Bacteroidales bacterium]